MVGTSPIGRSASASAARSSARVRRTRVTVPRDRRRCYRSRSSGMPASDASDGRSGAPRPSASSSTASSIRTVSASPGNDPAATSAANARAASPIVSRRLAYGRAWRGTNSPEPEQVGHDLDLAAAQRSRADPDRRDAQPLGDGPRELCRHELEHDREGTGLLDGQGVGQQGPRLRPVLALDLDLAAETMLRLGCPTDVAHHRDARPDQRLDDPGGPDAALDLDRLRPRLLQEPARVLAAPRRPSRTTGTACRR